MGGSERSVTETIDGARFFLLPYDMFVVYNIFFSITGNICSALILINRKRFMKYSVPLTVIIIYLKIIQ